MGKVNETLNEDPWFRWTASTEINKEIDCAIDVYTEGDLEMQMWQLAVDFWPHYIA